jgi:hypothetical protein
MAYQFDEHNATANTYLDFARGHYKNVTPVQLFGFNRTIGTSFETVMNDGGGIYTFPSSALILSCVSSSTDTMPVYIYGLDADYLPISETVTLTGTTPATTTQQFFRINGAYITSGSNVGNITISNGGTTYAYIEAGTGMTQSVVYTTAANCKMYITSVSFTSGTVTGNKYLTGRVYKKTYGQGIMRFWEATWSSSSLNYDVNVPFVLPEKTDFTFEAKSSSSENEISIYVNALLIDNE